MRRFAYTFLVVMLSLVHCCFMTGQGSVAGKITGVVTDPVGAVVPGAVVTVSSPAMLQSKTQKSVEGGVYSLESLPPGEYQLTCSMPGFKGYQQKGLVLTAGFTATINITLATGDTTETIEVSGADPIVDVQS